jgi:hypothetical protein
MQFAGMPIWRVGNDVANADERVDHGCPMPASLWLMAGLKKAITTAATRTAPANAKRPMATWQRRRRRCLAERAEGRDAGWLEIRLVARDG